jgi:protein-S-isoprenylcysteine O-methyltransferase Ste14
LWLFTLAYLIHPASMEWAALPLPSAVRWAGAVTGVLCAALMYWTLSSLGKNLTDTVTTRAGATLVTHGPYRYVRHPFYVVAGLLMLSVTLLSASAAIGAAGLTVITLLALRTPNEERRLAQAFGEPYEEYRRRTGAFFPKWRRSGG